MENPLWGAPRIHGVLINRYFASHPPYERAQLRFDLRSPSQWERLQNPVAAKVGPVPAHERAGLDDCETFGIDGSQRYQLNKEPAIIVRELDATKQPTPYGIQLMSKHRVFSFGPQLRLEWRGQDGQNETEQPDHSASLGDSSVHVAHDRGLSQAGHPPGDQGK